MNDIDTSYRRRLTAELVCLGLLFLVLFSQHVSAQAPPFLVQHNGTTQFGANCLVHDASSPVYNFLDTCEQPVNDPNAINNIIGRFTQGAPCPNYSTATAQDFSQLWGRKPDNTIVTQWPYWPSTSLLVPLPAHGRYYGGVINAGLNPGITPHYLKGNGYASCGLQTPPTARVDVRVVAVGNTPAPTGLCSKTNLPFDNNPWVWLKFAGPVNTSHCMGVIGGRYRYIVENHGSVAFNALMTWN